MHSPFSIESDFMKGLTSKNKKIIKNKKNGKDKKNDKVSELTV